MLKTTQNSSADTTLQSNQQQEHRAGTEKASDLIIGGTRGYCISSVSREDIPVVRINPSIYKLLFASEKTRSWTKMPIWMLSFFSFAEICITAINHTSLKLCAKVSKGKKICSDSRILPSDFHESGTKFIHLRKGKAGIPAHCHWRETFSLKHISSFMAIDMSTELPQIPERIWGLPELCFSAHR